MNIEVNEDEDKVIETKDNQNNNDEKPISMSNSFLSAFVGEFSQLTLAIQMMLLSSRKPLNLVWSLTLVFNCIRVWDKIRPFVTN